MQRDPTLKRKTAWQNAKLFCLPALATCFPKRAEGLQRAFFQMRGRGSIFEVNDRNPRQKEGRKIALILGLVRSSKFADTPKWIPLAKRRPSGSREPTADIDFHAHSVRDRRLWFNSSIPRKKRRLSPLLAPKSFSPAKILGRGRESVFWQSHGVALSAFDLGNGALYAPFPDRGAESTARETQA